MTPQMKKTTKRVRVLGFAFVFDALWLVEEQSRGGTVEEGGGGGLYKGEEDSNTSGSEEHLFSLVWQV